MGRVGVGLVLWATSDMAITQKPIKCSNDSWCNLNPAPNYISMLRTEEGCIKVSYRSQPSKVRQPKWCHEAFYYWCAYSWWDLGMIVHKGYKTHRWCHQLACASSSTLPTIRNLRRYSGFSSWHSILATVYAVVWIWHSKWHFLRTCTETQSVLLQTEMRQNMRLFHCMEYVAFASGACTAVCMIMLSQPEDGGGKTLLHDEREGRSKEQGPPSLTMLESCLYLRYICEYILITTRQLVETI